jgi:hypothetical protein
MDIWAACREAVDPSRHQGELLRMVESQEQIATRALVDDLAEQALLEQLLEQSKPPLPAGSGHLDYLLASPFRYPPLEYGSRFGSRFEPSLFYGALETSSVLAETAFYRLVFWSGMSLPPPAGRLTTEHTLFAANYDTEQGLSLHLPPFDNYREYLTNPSSYAATQLLGSEMRAAGIELFIYRSARDPQGGLNIGLFNATPFIDGRSTWKQAWLCDVSDDEVAFYNVSLGTTVFKRELFLVDEKLPAPAS